MLSLGRKRSEGQVVLRERADADVLARVAVGVYGDFERGFTYKDDAVGVRGRGLRTRLEVVERVREEGHALLLERAEHGPDAFEVVRH